MQRDPAGRGLHLVTQTTRPHEQATLTRNPPTAVTPKE